MDGRLVARVATGICLVGVALASGLLLWTGVQKNAQITRLRDDGVPVQVTVAACRGLMGGSGSNLVGYACTGTFTLGGRRYEAALPDGSPRTAGSTFRAVTAPGDPGLLSTPAAVASERPSSSVFVAPTVLMLLLALSAAALALRRRR